MRLKGRLVILGGKTWLGWIGRTSGAVAVWLGGGLVAIREASDSIPKPPANPGWIDLLQWIASASDPAALIAAIASGLWLVASLFQIFGPKPYTAAQSKLDRQHQNESFKTLDGRTQTGLNDLKEGRSEDTLKLDEILALLKAQGGTGGQQLETAAEEVRELAQSADPADRAVAQTAFSGDTREAYAELMAEASSGKLRNAERFRKAARLIAPFEPAKAKAAYEEAVALDPTDVWSWIELGRLRMAYDSLAAARQCFGAALQHVTDERDRSVLHGQFGNVLMAEGQLGDARLEYEAASSIAQKLAQSEPRNADLQRDLLVSYNKIGDVEHAAGNLIAARQRYEASLAIAERLAEQEPDNAGWQRDLSVSYDRVGDVEQAVGNLTAARQRYEAGLAISERLAQQEPSNAEWQRDLSISSEKLGDVERAAGSFGAARKRYEASLAISERLAQQEPKNAVWQRDLSVSYIKLGDVEQKSNSLAAARVSFEAGLAIRTRLAKQEPGNAGWQRDLSVSYIKLGDVELAANNLAAARTRYEAGLAIVERLAQQEPGSPGWQRDVSVSYNKLGNVEQVAGNIDAARTRYEAGLAIAERLCGQQPGNADWQRDLWVCNGNLGQLAMLEGNVSVALEHFREAERVMAALAARWPDHPGFASALATVRNDIARIESSSSGQE
jgi:tetratricopeptide (TPR) repeat protein